ncbi:hypothetical protein BKA70DRAFT_1370273 [Coprinopsis sp. MPI-PUGE-AT-0042]|nr:hypothetical protein BKA70DRAFT_1370273 [Coprinopsis sp. MPI-PUGE-AT-0042]
MSLPTSSTSHCASSSGSSLKRPASPSFENSDQPARKRAKEDVVGSAIVDSNSVISTNSKLADELALELQCGCCSELVYNPVIVLPCQHFFCGSCCVLWIRNGGTNCPACRGVSTVTVVDTLLRIAPEKARTVREREQADAVYRSGLSLRIPSPREPSPEPAINVNADLAQPCPHCAANNPHGWRCPQPIADPATDADNAWHLDGGMPPGHGQCGHCENLLAVDAPNTTSCDLCKVPFCGINIPGRCTAVLLQLQQPQGLSSISDLIESADVYDCFDGNNFEVDVVFDYLRTHDKTPRHLYREIIAHLLSQPRGLLPLLESDAFSEINGSGPENVPQGPHNRICRVCAYEVLIWGMREWWVRERQKGLLDPSILRRPDCHEGSRCQRQRETAHAKEFNHIVSISQPSTNASHAQESSRVPLQLLSASSSSADAVERMVLPASQTQPPSAAQHRSSALSYLLNADFDGTAVLGRAMARELRSSSPDTRDTPNALS